MALTNSFAWDNLPSIDDDGETTTTAARLPIIKKFVKLTIIFGSVFNVIYTTIRLASSEQRIPPANSYYIFDISPSPIYEVIALSQVHSMAHLSFSKKRICNKQ
jgi:hypothetical protein